MKKLILLILALPTVAWAFVPPQSVANECVRQMNLGICSVAPDRSTIPPGQTMTIAGVGVVSYDAYLDYMDKYNPAMPSDPAMCELALTKMTSTPGSDHDKVARALWTPPPEAEPVTNLADIVVKAGLGVGVAGLAFLALRRRLAQGKSPSPQA